MTIPQDEKDMQIEVTTAEAGMKKETIYQAVFKAAVENHGMLEMKDIYELIDSILAIENKRLSDQGKASLRRLINTVAVNEGFILPYDKDNPGWRITSEARALIEEQSNQQELVFNQETEREEVYIPNVVKGAIFEKYCLGLLKTIYPYYSWFHQGQQKQNERGLDLIGEKIGEISNEYKTIGVQIKNHQINSSPSEKEWLKFLAGCFVRRIDKAILITTGRLTSEQRREAGEAKINVIEGLDEINRIAEEYKYNKYEEF